MDISSPAVQSASPTAPNADAGTSCNDTNSYGYCIPYDNAEHICKMLPIAPPNKGSIKPIRITSIEKKSVTKVLMLAPPAYSAMI